MPLKPCSNRLRPNLPGYSYTYGDPESVAEMLRSVLVTKRSNLKAFASKISVLRVAFGATENVFMSRRRVEDVIADDRRIFSEYLRITGAHTPPPQPSPICHIYAEMDERVILNRVTSLEVIISGDELKWQDSATGKGGEVPVDPQKRLLIQAVAKTNFVIESDDRVEVDPPAPGQVHQIYFDLRATHLGEGEVWVIVRQGQVSLLTLTINPQIVQPPDCCA